MSTIVQGDWDLSALVCDGTSDSSVFDEGSLKFSGEKATLVLTTGSCEMTFPFQAMFQGETQVRFGGDGEISCSPDDCNTDLCGTDISAENWGFTIAYDDTTEPDTPTLSLTSLETDRGPSTSCADASLGTTGGYLFARP